MPAAPRPGIVGVAAREVAWIWRDRVALLLVVGIPLLAFALLAATFSNAVIRDLRVDVVDQDRSQTSMTFVQAIGAAPGVTVAGRSADLSGAMHAIRSGDAIAAVYIPENLERDILAGRRPQIVIFSNKQFFTPGNVAASALQAAVSAAAADLPAGARSAAFTPGPLVVEQYVLTNPALNYAQFLLRAILPTVLHVVIAIAGGYAVGSEFGARGVRGWLAAAGGRPLTALVGKLLPYAGIFLVMMALGLGIIHGLYGIPFRGDPVIMGAAACLLIVAYLCLGAFFQLLVRNLPTGLSLTAIVCSPAFGFAGVGFPLLAMGTFARVWGALLPLRWYIQILFDQAARGVPARDSVEPFLMLAALAALYFALAWLRLHAIAANPDGGPAEAAAPDRPVRPGIAAAFAAEYGRVLRDRGVFGLIVLGPIIYGVFYPQPYLGQLIRGIPIAVVDDDGSDLSRTIVQTLNADEAITVALRPTTLAEAQAALARREVFGILGIPAGTERDVLKGEKARLPAFVDSAYFLLYNRTLQGISEAAGAVTADLIARSARPDGSLYRAALAQSSPIEILNQPLFNPTGGYASYVVPAAFLLILQQTLLMGAATLGGVTFEQGGREARRRRGGPAAVIGQAIAHLLLALPGFALYLVVLPRIYGFSASDHVLAMLAMAIPFILAVSFLGQFLGTWFRRRETAVLMLIAISLPLFFLVGVAWPPEAIPPILRSVSAVFPSTSGIQGLVRINQMGAGLADVSQDWARLWLLTGIYAVLAIAASWIATAGRTRDER
ncbi:ABC transporter permease [Labrys wisconsinensis]|uniref:ABC-2 type transport system permease protein n=1 Tax=Labrys wisconsinensis TaxID=425677 RepID=A0ABU0JHU8_9HYPH|nr:ABC transporter permease [Labrys wisconsinensis]MDQ0473862.1 ABC-2 type transport system permease protein [Labrys wisconsinensis]